MSKPLAVLFCPGRGAYGRDELGFLRDHHVDGPVAEALLLADAARPDGPTISELDQAASFRPSQHLNGVNAAELIYLGTMFHLEHLRQRYEIVAVCGNSLGWYTALAASGALTSVQGWQLVRGMAELQREVDGAQVLTTTVGDDWRPDPVLLEQTGKALEEVQSLGEDYFVAPAIDLGGHAVFGGTTKGVRALMQRLPEIKVGDRGFPFQLAGNGPFHTPLCFETATKAQSRLANILLAMTEPRTHLVDGIGNVHSPWSADPTHLYDYTVTTQVLETFDFTACVRTAIREFNPDVLLCAGPGTSLRAPVGHVALWEGYRGIGTKEELFASELVRVD